MAIFKISDVEPAVIITGDEKSLSSLVKCALLMDERSLKYRILTDEFYPELKKIKAKWIESVDESPFAPNILMDFSWDGSISFEAEDVSQEYPSVAFLSSSITPDLDIEDVEELATTALRFNGLNGFFLNVSTLEFAYPTTANSRQVGLAQRFFELLGFSVEVVENRTGFILPRIVAMLVNEASFCVMEKVGKLEDIDTAMKLGTNYPKGPLAWGDEIGLNVILSILDSLYEEYGQERYRASSLLRQKVLEGKIGVKSGEGFYQRY